MSHNISSMKDLLKRFLGCLLVLATCVGSQVVCPMMLFPQLSHACGSHHSAASVTTANQGATHDCCPRKPGRPQRNGATPELIDQGNSVMSCCSVPSQPAISAQQVQSDAEMAVVTQVSDAGSHSAFTTRCFDTVDCGPASRGVLNLKEDLRI